MIMIIAQIMMIIAQLMMIIAQMIIIIAQMIIIIAQIMMMLIVVNVWIMEDNIHSLHNLLGKNYELDKVWFENLQMFDRLVKACKCLIL